MGEDEIGNFKCRDYKNINKETVSTSNVTVVNGVEFPVVINLNQHDHINEDKNEQLKKGMYVEEELVAPIEEFECGQLEEVLQKALVSWTLFLRRALENQMKYIQMKSIKMKRSILMICKVKKGGAG